MREEKYEYIGVFGDLEATLDRSRGGTDDRDDAVFAANRDVLSLRGPPHAADSGSARELIEEDPLLTLDAVDDDHLVAVDDAHKRVRRSGDKVVVFSVDVDRGTLAHVTVHLHFIFLTNRNESFILEDALLLVVHDHIDATDSIWKSVPRTNVTSLGRDKETC